MRLLIIEDDKELCDTMAYHLKQEGYEVDTCYCGDEADFYFEQGMQDAVILDPQLHILKNGEEQVSVSKKETLVLEFFMRNKNQVLSRNQILSKVWGMDNFVEEGNIDNYIYFVRRRLTAVKSNVKIKTIHGVGYKMEME